MYYILNDKSGEISEMEEEFQIIYLASIVDGYLISLKFNEKISNWGKSPFDLKNTIKLIFYGYINKITSIV